jgi:hypothetical protein
MRASHEWFLNTAITGRWWEPAFWECPDFLSSSPWELARFAPGYELLKKLYTEELTRSAFAWVAEPNKDRMHMLRDRPLWAQLADANRADLSGLVRFALDVLDAEVFAYPDLVRRLREDVYREFKGARFELRCLAAFANANIEVDYEPLAAEGGKNPDFRLNLQEPLYIDAKHSDEGDWIKEEREWFWKLSILNPPSGRAISAHIGLTEEFRVLQDTEDGRVFIRANIDRLASLIAPTKERLADSGGPFPVAETIEGFIEVQVMGPPGQASSGSASGVSSDARREVARIVRGAITRGATQIPPAKLGIVLLNPGLHAPTHLLVEEVQRWINSEGEGADHPNLLGVLIVNQMLFEPIPGFVGYIDSLVPVWRPDAPEWVMDGPWESLSEAIGLQGYEVLAHRCSLARSELAGTP